MTVEVRNNYNQFFDVNYIDSDILVIGNSDGCVFYNKLNIIYRLCFDEDIVQLNQDDLFFGDLSVVNADSRILVDLNQNLYLVENSIFSIYNEELLNSTSNPFGFFNNLEQLEEVEDALSLGDIDQDGYDEKLLIINNNCIV